MGGGITSRPGRRARAGVAIVCAAALAGCTTTGGSTGGGWQIDSVAARCAASVVGGAVVGALIGAATGGGNRSVAAGAAIGAGGGAVACAVFAALDAQDRARIREAQLLAARTGRVQTVSYTGSNGATRSVVARPGPVQPARGAVVSATRIGAAADAGTNAADRGERVCRPVGTSVTVQGEGNGQIQQLVCRTPSGDWAPA